MLKKHFVKAYIRFYALDYSDFALNIEQVGGCYTYMISILTLTYHRRPLLEEALYSFLSQKYSGCEYEMVIINDAESVEYEYIDKKINIINRKERFDSISAKIQYGYMNCKYDYIYRLDDDDLLAPNAIEIMHKNILHNPGYEIYRSRGHYFFCNNKFVKISDNINNGNMYSKNYFNRIIFPNKTSDEDVDLTFGHSATTFHYDPSEITMIYRWGTGDYHISSIGTGAQVLDKVDKIAKKEYGKITLVPHFLHNYYEQLPD